MERIEGNARLLVVLALLLRLPPLLLLVRLAPLLSASVLPVGPMEQTGEESAGLLLGFAQTIAPAIGTIARSNSSMVRGGLRGRTARGRGWRHGLTQHLSGADSEAQSGAVRKHRCTQRSGLKNERDRGKRGE